MPEECFQVEVFRTVFRQELTGFTVLLSIYPLS